MKFLFKSDFHLEFHIGRTYIDLLGIEEAVRKYARKMYKDTVGEECLPVLLGGDYANTNDYSRYFIDEICKLADHVFVVFGNHDLYLVSPYEEAVYEGDSYGRIEELKKYLASHKNLSILENFSEVVEYKGLRIAGSMNWYKLEEFMQRIQFKMMNDSRYIKNVDIGHMGFKEDVAFDELEQVDIMLTHVSPIITESNHRKGAECYSSLRDVTKARYWFCGHVHENFEYEKAGTKVFTNANGYDGEIDTKDTAHKFGIYEIDEVI